MTSVLPTLHEVLQLFLSVLLHVFHGQSTVLESAPNCGQLGDSAKTECIWDCEWVTNTLHGTVPVTGSATFDSIIMNLGLTYTLIKYPSNPACTQDCGLQDVFLQIIQSGGDVESFVRQVLFSKPNIDSVLLELCLLYYQLNMMDAITYPDSILCVPRILVPRSAGPGPKARISGNSLSNSYRNTTALDNTLAQYPWACSLRTKGFRGRHICGATLLSAPPSRTVLVGAAHCNYICKDVDGTPLETCCCRDPDNNFASCRSTSSYCGTDGRLRLAAAEDLLLVCGEWSTAGALQQGGGGCAACDQSHQPSIVLR